jgi:hypothetical protein
VQLRRRAHAPDVAVDDHDHRGRIDNHHRGSVHYDDHHLEHDDLLEHDVVDLHQHEHQHVDVDQHHRSAHHHDLDDATDVDDKGVDHHARVDDDDRGDRARLVE